MGTGSATIRLATTHATNQLLAAMMLKTQLPLEMLLCSPRAFLGWSAACSTRLCTGYIHVTWSGSSSGGNSRPKMHKPQSWLTRELPRSSPSAFALKPCSRSSRWLAVVWEHSVIFAIVGGSFADVEHSVIFAIVGGSFADVFVKFAVSAGTG